MVQVPLCALRQKVLQEKSLRIRGNIRRERGWSISAAERFTEHTSTLIRNVNPRSRWHRSAKAAQLAVGQCVYPDHPLDAGLRPQARARSALGARRKKERYRCERN
jgi:hypothetical protein